MEKARLRILPASNDIGFVAMRMTQQKGKVRGLNDSSDLSSLLLSKSESTVKVFFHQPTDTANIVSEVSNLRSPHLILWYIGPFGLKKRGVTFYRENLLNPIFAVNKKARFYLVDLTAWGAFKSSLYSIDKSSSCCSIIDNFPGGRVQCIKSSHILKKIQTIQDQEITDYFNITLRKSFLQNASRNFPEVGIKLGSILQQGNPILKEWAEADVGKMYSLVQYLEGCFLVDEVVSKARLIGLDDEIDIAFILPNNEFEYYLDEVNSFQHDVEFLLLQGSERKGDRLPKISIHFYSFKYGSDPMSRPYNASGEVFKKNKLSFLNIADYAELSVDTQKGGGHAASR